MPFTVLGTEWLECGARQRFLFWGQNKGVMDHIYTMHGKQRWLALSPFGDSKHHRHPALTHGDLITIFLILDARAQ